MKPSISDAEYAVILRGSATPGDIEWLHRHLRGDSQPKLPGFKAGRKWRATEEMVEQAIELLAAATSASLPAVPSASSMTRTSRRKLTGGPPRVSTATDTQGRP